MDLGVANHGTVVARPIQQGREHGGLLRRQS
jgi:hypothetical protein